MKNNVSFFIFLTLLIVVIGCEKKEPIINNNSNNRAATTPANFKLRQIIGPMDTVILLTNNDTLIGQTTENFIYDNADKLVKKTMSNLRKIGINGATTYDTSETLIYNYNSTNYIVSYTEAKNGFIFNHIIDYDIQNRFIRDSVMNQQGTQTTTITCRHLQDTVVMINRNNISAITDTLVYSNNTLVKQFINSRNQNGFVSRFVYNYTSNTNTNPLSLLGNFNLYAADYTTGTIGMSMFKFKDTYKMVKNVSTQINRNGVIFFYNNLYDNFGRIIEMRDSYNGNKITKYNYY